MTIKKLEICHFYMDLLKNLNPEQLEAVKHQDGPLLIVAGAGTGKTTVISQRIAYLIEQGQAKADEVLALTFTEKAAGEMADRVGGLLPYGYFDLWISTFHSFSERILKEHGLAIGLSTDFKLLNEFAQWALVKKNLDKFDLDYYRPLGNPTKFIHALIKHFSRAKDEDISPSAYLEYADGLKQDFDQMLSGSSGLSLRPPSRNSEIKTRAPRSRVKSGMADLGEAADDQEAARINEVANAYQVYQQLLLDNNALDFGDLINYTLKLFRERPAILAAYRRQFKYILLDEFQDTNWSQYELIKVLAAPKNNLVVVGDDDQSIFRFRGASMSNILQFVKDYPRTKKIILVKNYRSRQNILDWSYEFIKQNNPNRLEWQLQTSPLDTGDLKNQALNKKLVAEHKGAGEIEVIQADDLAAEVSQVVNKISDIKSKDKTASWDDFAILVRANDSASVFMNELDRRGWPYLFGARRGLYAKLIIMDVISYFKLLDNYHESVSLWRILNLPIYDFTDEELANFNHLAHKKAWSLYEVISRADVLRFDAELRNKIAPLLALIAKHSAAARDKAASEIFLAFMNESGYLKYLTLWPAATGAVKAGPAEKTARLLGSEQLAKPFSEQKNLEAINLLNQFLKRIQAFEAVNADKSVKNFLAELNLEMESGEAGGLPADLAAGPEAIKILTVHGAKGLEFKYVFIVNLVDKRFPTIERNEPINLPDALIKEILPAGDAHLEEERRLFYVAMTRAKAGLYFSWARDYGGLREKKPSRFLTELGLRGKTSPTPQVSQTGAGLRGLKATDKIPPTPFPPERPSGRAGVKEGKIFKVRGGGIPAYFSYSQLAAYSNCPYQYRFAHILKIPVMGKEQFSFGKTMHATMQKLFTLINEKTGLGQANLFGDITSPNPLLSKEGNKTVLPLDKGEIKEGVITFEEILKLYEQSWVDDWYKDKASKEARRKQGREILKIFYEKHKNRWPDVLFLEKGFSLKIIDPSAKPPSANFGASGAEEKNVYMVRGVIDRIDKVPSAGSGQAAGIKLVDYKTGRAKQKLSFTEKEQLFIYQLAAQELFKEPVSGLAFYYLDNNSEVEFIGEPADLTKIKTKIIFTIKEIRRGEFPPRPGQICAWCDFRDICEYRA